MNRCAEGKRPRYDQRVRRILSRHRRAIGASRSCEPRSSTRRQQFHHHRVRSYASQRVGRRSCWAAAKPGEAKPVPSIQRIVILTHPRRSVSKQKITPCIRVYLRPIIQHNGTGKSLYRQCNLPRPLARFRCFHLQPTKLWNRRHRQMILPHRKLKP